MPVTHQRDKRCAGAVIFLLGYEIQRCNWTNFSNYFEFCSGEGSTLNDAKWFFFSQQAWGVVCTCPSVRAASVWTTPWEAEVFSKSLTADPGHSSPNPCHDFPRGLSHIIGAWKGERKALSTRSWTGQFHGVKSAWPVSNSHFNSNWRFSLTINRLPPLSEYPAALESSSPRGDCVLHPLTAFTHSQPCILRTPKTPFFPLENGTWHNPTHTMWKIKWDKTGKFSGTWQMPCQW